MAPPDPSTSLASQLASFRRSHPPQGRVIDGIPFQYHALGQGPQAVVILPGLLGAGEMSFQLATSLGTRYRVLVPSWPRAANSAARLLRGLAGILDGEGIKRAALVGASFGGLVAQHFALHYPDRVTGLVLADTSVPVPARASKNRRAARVFSVLPSSLVRWLLRKLGGRAMRGADPTGFWISYTAEIVAGLGAPDLAARYRAAADFDAAPGLDGRALASRTLLIECDDDPVVGKEASRALRAAFPGAALHVFPQGGHAPSILHPQQYADVVAAFLEQVTA